MKHSVSTKAPNKSCWWELNFLKETQEDGIFTKRRARGYEDCHVWNINVLKWESRFTLGISGKNTDYIEKYFK